MINYRLETLTSWDEEETGLYYWSVKIYANSDFLKFYIGFSTRNEAERTGEAFIDGIKFARGES